MSPARPFPRETGLAARTMFLLGLLYVAFVAVLAAIGVGFVLVLVIAVGVLVAQFWFSDRVALFAMGGREVRPEEAPQLHGLVDRLCAMADMPKPRVAVADADLPNDDDDRWGGRGGRRRKRGGFLGDMFDLD